MASAWRVLPCFSSRADSAPGGRPPFPETSAQSLGLAIVQSRAATSQRCISTRAHSGEVEVSSFARVDTERSARTGFPEVVWGPGKTPEQVADILDAMSRRQAVAMATRIDPHTYEQVSILLPGVVYHSLARIVTYERPSSGGPRRLRPDLRSDQPEPSDDPLASNGSDRLELTSQEEFFRISEDEGEDCGAELARAGRIVIVCAGTSDLPVAEEARVTIEVMGFSASQIVDVGVAGIHRLLNQIDKIRQADVVVVVAGMDGALPSVVAGLVAAPIIAVPTSIGYGASFGGVAALLTMLNSCSPGLTVVNIDNGFGAALAACRILRLLCSSAKLESLRTI